MFGLNFGNKDLILKNQNLEKEVERLKDELGKKGSEDIKVLEFKLESKDEKIASLEAMIIELKNAQKNIYDAECAVRSEERARTEELLNDYKKNESERVENLAKEIVASQSASIKADNISLTKENAQLKDDLKIYKDRFENGKVAVGFDEIKGILLSANPNAGEAIRQIKAGGI